MQKKTVIILYQKFEYLLSENILVDVNFFFFLISEKFLKNIKTMPHYFLIS